MAAGAVLMAGMGALVVLIYTPIPAGQAVMLDVARDGNLKARVEARVDCVAHHLQIPTPGVVLAEDIYGWAEPEHSNLLGLWIEKSNLVVASVEDGPHVLAETVAHEMAHAALGDEHIGPHAIHGANFVAAYMKSLAYMAHCRRVDDDAIAPLTVQSFPPGEGMLVVEMPFGEYETPLRQGAYRRIALGAN